MRTPAGVVACLALAAALACASAPERRGEATPDRTRDPEFEAARKAARPEFESQAEALAAGVYEPFVHPDSVAAGGVSRPAPPAGPEQLGPRNWAQSEAQAAGASAKTQRRADATGRESCCMGVPGRVSGPRAGCGMR